MTRAAVDELVAAAEAAAAEADIRGPEQTPFMLSHMAKQSRDATVRINAALVRANARLAGQLAAALASSR